MGEIRSIHVCVILRIHVLHLNQHVYNRESVLEMIVHIPHNEHINIQTTTKPKLYVKYDVRPT